MFGTVDLSYLTTPVDNADQAVSFAEYLNQHGILASRDGIDGVITPIDDLDKIPLIDMLHKTWKLYWEASDSGLFGLPVLIDETSCPHCGVGG